MNKPELIKDIENRVEIEQIKNNLTETTSGNVLDASQGKVLNDKIEQLVMEGATLTNKINVLDDKVNWKVNDWKTQTDLPSAYSSSGGNRQYYFVAVANDFGGQGAYSTVHTIVFNSNFAYQYVYNRFKPIRYRQTDSNNTWGSWETLATTTKTEILFTPSTGISLDNSVSWANKIIKNGDDSYDLWFCVKKTDGSVFGTGAIQIGTLPFATEGGIFFEGNGCAYINNNQFGYARVYCNSNRLMAHNNYSNALYLKGHIRFRV